MKKYFIICMLAMTGMITSLCAQERRMIFYIGKTKTQQLFDIIQPSLLRHTFMMVLKNGNHVTVQVAEKAQFEQLMNLDSAIRSVAKDLIPLKDSLQDGLSNKRVDYLLDQSGVTKIRVIEYPSQGTSYIIKGDEASLLKIEQDTINIIGYEFLPYPKIMDSKAAYLQKPYKVTILINNISQLSTLTDGTLNAYMIEFKQQWDGLKKWNRQNNWKTNLYGYRSVTEPTLNRNLREPYLSGDGIHPPKLSLSGPYIQVGLQNINNMLVTSTGVGIMITDRMRRMYEAKYQLFWEPYFFFDRSNDKFKLRRNDFVTFQYISKPRTSALDKAPQFGFSQNFSAGYLVHRSGDYFKENTFKFGLPGMQFRILTLHPEFIFNGLFKNFQPSLKLFLDLD